MNFLRLKHFVIFLFFIQIQSISAQTNSSNTFNPNRVWNDFLPSADCFFESDFTNNFNIRLAAESAPDVVTFATPMVGDMTGDGIPEILILAKPTNKERLGFSWYEWDYLEEGKYGSVTYITRDINVYNYQTGPPDQLVRTGIVRTPDLHFEGPNPFLIAKIPQLSNEPLVIVATSHLQTTPGYAKYKSRLIAYRLNNTDADDYVWISKEEYGKNVPNGSTGVQYKSGAAPGIADFNGDGIPEVYIYNEIFSLKPADNGKKLTDGGAFGQGVQLTSLGGGSMRGGSIGVSVAADVIPGGNLELVAGKSVYELDGSFNIIRRIDAPNVNGQAARDGFTSIADINRDGVLDVIITTARTDVPDSRLVYVWTVNGGSGILIARQSILDAGAGVDKGNVRATGLAFIGDIDKNGTPEIGLTSPLRLWMFYYDGTTTLKSKWTGPLITADRSGYTLITMFDFDQDGKQELVYRDESTLRIIDGSGASPTIKSSIPVGAATAGDGAVIADVNQDGEADIIVTNQHGFVGNIQDGYFGEPYAKLAVFRSDGNPWAPSRSVWNQYAYFNFNVNDDLTIPVPQLNHGTVASVFFPRFNAFGCLEGDEQPFNSFLVQTTLYNDAGCKITGDPLMDAQIELDQARFICYTSGPQIESIFTITNAGNALLPKETPISFYVDNVFILVKTLAQLGLGDISPDQSEEVTLVLDSSVADNLVSGSQKLKAIINWDNASQKFVYDECIYDNEFIAPIISRPVYEVESPQPVCEGESVFLEPKKSSYVDPTTGVPVESVESTQLKWYKDNVSGSPITNGTINGVSYTIDPINFSLLIEGLPASSSEQIFILVDGCTGRKVSVPVTVSPMPAISFEIQDVLCNGENTGRITNIIGDQSYLSYSLDGTTFITGNQLKATNFSAGIFTVTVIASQNSSASCEATFTFEITEPDPIVLTNQVITPPSCDLPNGTYSIDFEGGKTPYKLTLTKGSGVIETVSNLPTGTYTKSDLAPGSYLFTVTDANGCTISDPFILTNDPKQSINIVLADQEICEGQNVTLIPEINTGGNPRVVTWFYDALGTTKLVNGPDPKNGNISYTITGEELVISGLPSGAAKEYYVRVSGDLYCPIIEAVSITVLPPLTVTITATEIICFGDLVDITASATGGDGDFLYSLNGGATQSESIFKGVSAGDYTVTVTSANCTVTSDLVSVKAPPAPITLQGEQTIIGASCNESNGIIQNVVVTGGWGNYTIEWKKDDPNTGTVVGNQIPEITGLAAGNYFLVVKDSKGCVQDFPFVVNQQPLPDLEIANVAVCEGEEVTLIPVQTVSGASQTELIWYKDAAGSILLSQGIDPNNPAITYTISDESVLQIQGLPAGTYTYYLEIVCSGERKPATVVVSAAPNPVIEKTDVVCFGESTGKIKVTANSNANFLYSVNGAAPVNQSALEALSFAVGDYSIVITETGTDCSTTEEITIDQPEELIFKEIDKVDPACGVDDGIIEFEIGGGLKAYGITINKQPLSGYQVTENANVFTVSDLAVGQYDIQITDANGCIVVGQFILVEDKSNTVESKDLDKFICEGEVAIFVPELTITGSVTPKFTWFLDSDMTQPVTANYTAGGTGVMYEIDPATGQLSIHNLSLGAEDYFLQITDEAICTVTSKADVTVSAAPNPVIEKTDVVCFGDSTGKLKVTSNSNANYLYSVNGAATINQSALEALSFAVGDYSIVITETGTDCSTTEEITIDQPEELIFKAIDKVDPACGVDDGIIEFEIGGGLKGYGITINKQPLSGYQVTENANVFTVSDLAVGQYDIQITDANGCIVVGQFILVEDKSNTVESKDLAKVFCEGEVAIFVPEITITGSVTPTFTWYLDSELTQPVTANYTAGGTGIMYEIDPVTGQLSIHNLGLGAEDYFLQITDEAICTVTSRADVTVTISPNPVLETTDILCFGESTGKIKVTANSNSNYLYSVNGAAPIKQAALEALEFAAGDYTIVITETGNDCSTTEVVKIAQPEELIFKAIDQKSPACGVNDGTIQFEIVGGTEDYIITINNKPLADYKAVKTDQVFTVSELALGQYDIRVTDANGCKVVGEFTLLDDNSNTLQSKNLDKVFCEGEVAIFVPEITITGSVTPTFTWFLDSDMTQPVTANYTAGGTGVMYEIDPVTGQLSIHNLGLGAEDYFLQITDEAICTVTSRADVTVTISPNPVLETTDILCFGESTGKIKVTSNSNANYLYSVNGAAPIKQAALEALEFAAGDYTIVITETGNDCSTTEVVKIAQPEELIFKAIDQKSPACGVNDGTIQFEIVGGTEDYIITINNKPLADYKAVKTDQVFTVSELALGQYDIRVTDANGCKVVGEFTLLDDNSNTLQSKNLDKVFCEGEVAIFVPEITITGSVTPTFTWFLDSDMTQPVTANYTAGGTGVMYEIDPVTGQLSIHNLGLGAEDYFLQITDEAICTVTSRADVTVTISPNPVLETTDILCFGESTGKIKVTSNSNANYLYSVNGAAPIKQAALEALEFSAGDYTIVITETGNDCSTTETVKIAQPEELIFKAIDQKSPACGVNDGTIQFEIAGGTEDYIITINNKPLSGYQVTENNNVFIVSELALGQYDIRVTDANGCKVVGGFTLVDDSSNTLQSKNLDKVFCEGEVAIFVPEITITGSVTPTFTWFLDSDMTQPVTANYTAGGTGVMYEIDPVTGQLSIHNLGLGAEDYFLQITDEAICTVTSRADVKVTISPNPDLETTDILCFGESTGKIKVTSNSNTNYLYSVNGAASIMQAALEALEFAAGDYTIVITETGNDCSTTEVVKIAQPEELIFKAIDQKSPACGVNDGTIQFEIAGGTEDYIITINNKPLADYKAVKTDQVFTVSELALGQYDIRVTDANGCKVVGGFTLVDDSSNTLQSKNLDKFFCEGELAIFIPEITITGSVTPTFTWFLDSDMTQPVTANYIAGGTGIMYEIDPVTGQLSIHNLGLGDEDYFLQITDEAICTVTSRADVTVTISPNPVLETTDILCFGESTGKIKVTSNSNANYLYSVNGAAPIKQAALEALEFAAGDYTIVITETGNDCSTTEVVKIVHPEELIFKAIDQKSPACGVNDGTIQFEIAGGTEDYNITINNKPLSGYQVTENNNVYTVSDLALGQYDIRVTDANGCKVVGGFTLVDDSANTLQSKNLDKVFCEGEVAIFIPEITITGSVTPTFTWFLDSDMTQAVTANYTAGGTGIMYEIDPATGQLSIHNLGLGAEDYFLQITDEAICTVISRADVTVTISPNPVLEKSDVLCFGESNGKIKVTANSNSKYLYSVNGGATIKQAALEALEFAAGDYTIVITENGTSCSTTEKLTIAQPEELIFTKIDQKSPACGLDDGMIKFSVSGGVKDYIITVNNLPLSDFDFTLVNEKYTIQKLKLGQYDIVITDANGCKLSQPSAFILIDDNSNSVESKNLAVTICKGEEAILIPELVIKGSVTPKLTWYADAALTKAIVANYSPSGTGVMFDIDATTGKLTAYNLPVGINSYYLEITDDKICALSSRADITVTDIPSPEFSITDILCFGEKTGKIKVSAGSDPTLLFSIDGAPRITLNQLEAQIFTAGTYQIKTFYGNATCGDLQTIEIIQPDELKIEKVSFLNSSCGENNGELVFIISGGVKAYTVLINGQPLSSYSYAEENNRYVVNKLTPGKYTITSKDANGCVAPAAVFDLVNLAAMPITAKEMAAEACEGSVIKFTPDFNSGSVNPTKRWFTDASLTKEVLSNYNPTGTGIMYQIAPSTGELSVYNLSAGNHTYYLQLSDPQICTISVKAIGTVNAGITGEAVATGIVCFGDITGSISVKNLNGGSGNYEFSLDNITWQSNPLFENLKAGSYKVYVRDIGGQLPCQLIIPTVIVEGPAKPISINPDPSIINASCGLPNGIISNIAITGGWGAYQVEWRKDSPTGTLVTGNLNTAENLAPGKYYLIVKDSLGCSEVFNFEITALKDPLYSIVKPADFCAGESITLEAINSVSGAATTNYVWSKGPNRQNPIAAGTDPVIPSASYSLQEIDSRLLLDIQGLPAGTYKYYLFIECTSQELLFEFTVKASPVLEIDKSDISCFGAKDGKIFVKSGGSSDFTFSINNGPSITQTALESTKFQKGIYKVVVSNSIGCSSQEYTIEIKEPALLEITDLTFKNNACGSQNGEINVKWLGGTAEYTVQLLQNGNVISSKKVSTLATSFNNLASGSYEVSILDANLCSIKGSAPIEIVDGPSEIIADDLSICVGDIAIIQPKVIPENVNAIYSWYWGSILPANKLSNGDTRGAVDIQITSSGEIKLAGMAAGNNQTLWVTVSGAGICEGDEHKVLVSVKNAPTFTATSKDELCYGDGGSIQITSADLINLEFSLNSGAFAKYPNGLINKLVPGTYTLQGRYSTGCVTNFGQTITIVGPSKPLGFDDFKVISSSCNAPDGEISGILGGGTGPYTISLNNSQGVKVSQDIQSPTGVFSFSGLLANSYQVVAIDRNGCQISDKAVQLTEKTTVITADDVTICEGETAVIQASYSQDSPNVIFNWFYDKALTKPVLLNASADSFGAQYESTDQGNLSITSLPARNAPYSYFIQVAGQGICPPEVKEVKVRVSPLPTLRVSNPSIVCDPDQSVDLTQFIEGYNPNIFDYIVTSPVGVSLRVDQLSAVNVNGSYIVQAAFKGNSCFTQIEKIAVIIATTRVQSLFNYQIEISNTNILVNGDVQVFEDVDFVDASSGEVIIWNWEFGDGNTSNSINPTHQYTEPGQFVVKLTTIDKYGCTSEYQRVIDIFNDYQIIIPNAFTPDGGKNQYFIPKYRGISSMEFYVFTTWGELIFEANSLETIGWDGTFRGKQAINGNYVYKAVFKTRSGEVVERAGVFILIR